MEDFSSNSNKSKVSHTQAPATQMDKTPEVKAVASATRKKKSGARRFMENFIAEDAKDVKDYVIGDILLPALKDTIYDMFTNSLSMILGFGSGNNNRSRNSHSRLEGGGSYVSYKDYSSYARNDRQARRANPGRYRYSFDDIIFKDKRECDDVLFELDGVMEQYKFVSVADFYRAAGLDESEIKYTDSDYGWYNLAGASARYDRGAYIIDMPPVEQR